MNVLQTAQAAIRDAAAKVIDHQDQLNEPVWRRLFDVPREAHLIDQTREFAASLNRLIELPEGEIAGADLSAVRTEVDRVIDRLERRIDGLQDPKDAMPFVAAIYVLRRRFEELTILAR
jgi:hypothetical protein